MYKIGTSEVNFIINNIQFNVMNHREIQTIIISIPCISVSANNPKEEIDEEYVYEDPLCDDKMLVYYYIVIICDCILLNIKSYLIVLILKQ